MSNLSPRWRKIKVTTPDTLGPNYYNIQESLPLPNRVPFLSSKPRISELTNTTFCSTIYNANYPSRVIGGSSLRNKSKRVTVDIRTSPSPASYTPKYNVKKSHRAGSRPIPRGKKLYVCKVPYTLDACGPSIPSKCDANGYDYDKNGRLVKIPAEEYDPSKKPICYDVPNEPCLTTLLYKGCKWSISKTQRSEMVTKGGPGPAAYDARYHKIENDRDIFVREMARNFSFLPRYLDMVQTQIRRNDYPGPGSYNFADTMGCKKSLSLNPVGFGTRSKRTSLLDRELSDPAKFNTGKDMLIRSFSIKEVPFNVSCARFTSKENFKKPGPGQYSPIEGIEANLERALCTLTDKAPPFNHSAERNTLPVAAMTITPAPNIYALQKMSESALCQGSVFKSVTGRFDDKKDLQSAEPATYNVSGPFNRSRNRKSHNVGRAPFQANAARRTFTVTSITPDPCKYTSPSEMDPKGYTFPTRERFVTRDETPGPANYNIHPSLTVSTYKATGTFNLRLKEQVLRTKLRLAPEKTWQAWHSEIKKRKQLFAFYRPPKKISSWLDI